MMELIFATNNSNKLKEIKAKLNNAIKVISLSEIGFTEDIPETAETLEGNAFLKAKAIFEKTQKPVFSDDTGLEVEALNGEPGVLSARYAGAQKSSSDNIEKLLNELKNIENRRARFRTVICFYDGSPKYFEGIVEGEIVDFKGDDGFGYDPVFKPSGCSQTFAEMSLELKNKISHRALAFEKFIEYLNLKS